MKIAAATSDEKTVSMHFGQAPKYVVVTVEYGAVVGREVREKAFHHHAPPDTTTIRHTATTLMRRWPRRSATARR